MSELFRCGVRTTFQCVPFVFAVAREEFCEGIKALGARSMIFSVDRSFNSVVSRVYYNLTRFFETVVQASVVQFVVERTRMYSSRRMYKRPLYFAVDRSTKLDVEHM